MIPKGYVFNCPQCNKPLYVVRKDVKISEQVSDTLIRFGAIFPQPLISNTSDIEQYCHYCRKKFNFLDLVKKYWRK